MVDKNELILEGLAYTVMGILIVFMILVIIMLVIKAMALFSGNGNNKKKEEPVKKAESAPEVKSDNGAIVAAITAAIAAILGKSATGFRIRSYRKIQDGEWNKAGRRDVLNRI